jgi:hypothetical protein
MGILHHIKVNINGLEQKSGMIIRYTRQRADLQSKFCRSDILKQNVSEMGIKLHRIFPNHYTMLKNIQPFRRKLKSVFIAITFYSVGENVLLFLVMVNMCMIGGHILRN